MALNFYTVDDSVWMLDGEEDGPSQLNFSILGLKILLLHLCLSHFL